MGFYFLFLLVSCDRHPETAKKKKRKNGDGGSSKAYYAC